MEHLKQMMIRGRTITNEYKNIHQTKHIPKKLITIDNKCSICNTQITEQIDNKRKLIYECKSCRGSWPGCNCHYDNYKYLYIKCLNCMDNNRCTKCNEFEEELCTKCKLCIKCTDEHLDFYKQEGHDINYTINVKYNEKDIVKSLGAKWNNNIKTWYVPHKIDHNLFSKWSPNKYNNTICGNCLVNCDKCKKVKHKNQKQKYHTCF